ncbi:MAG: endopeptidase La [Lachnospiraceae bacterium]|nr:endopeptidase La [Lachnospiraceae bacterium]
MRKKVYQTLPMIVFRDLVMMPETSVHIDVKREDSLKTIEYAMKENLDVFVVTAKDAALGDTFSRKDLYEIGTIVQAKQMLKLPKDVVRVMLLGQTRAKIKSVVEDPMTGHMATVAAVETQKDSLSDTQRRAYLKTVKDILIQCESNGIITNETVVNTLKKVRSLETLVDLIAEAAPITTAQKQKILETMDLKERTEALLEILLNEIEIGQIRTEIVGKLRECVNKNQRDYVLREQMKVIRQELGEEDSQDEGEQYLKRLEEVDPPIEVREKIAKEIKKFQNLPYSSSESAVLRNYIETVLEYPWNKSTTENSNLKDAMNQLEKDHYGLEKVKERIIDYLAVRNLSGRKDAPILCLVGPPGTGKTSIAHSIATALHKEYGRIALGGVRDEAEIRGHRKTYIGAMPGRIVSAITKTGVNNPLILLDEIDKTSSDYKGDTSSALLEVLDGEQNSHFVDHYFEVPVDLSSVLFIATANDASTIPAPLRDRMELIEVNSYTENEKFHIAKLYLLPKQRAKNGLKSSQFKMTDGAVHKLIRDYTREAGVRSLERRIERLMQKAARGILTEEYKMLRVTEKKLVELLGVEPYSAEDRDHTDRVGVVTGLAWTKVGGDTLQIEVNILNGKGGLVLTGNLGDVMKESAQIALSYVRTLPDIKKMPENYFEKHQIHLHVPEGATPKDGPSAGITMALAIYSALVNRPVNGRLAMTGEISLKGQVLPIGGLKEKLLAAKNAGMTKVFVPAKNQKNVNELEAEIIEGMDIIYVSDMREVIAGGIVKRGFALKQK